MTSVAAQTMAARLTEPFAPGADTQDISLTKTAQPADADVPPFDFTDHLARYEHEPNPFYLLVARTDIPADTLVTVDFGPPAGSVTLAVARGTLAGTSLRVPGLSAEAATRPLKVHVSPSTVAAADLWQIKVLLGTTARLLWVIGSERDQLRGHLQRVVGQRHIGRATGRSLDFIGSDLGVPRFPPLPYPFDADTVALYHLDDEPTVGQPEVATVADVVTPYQPPGHAGTNVGLRAQSRVPGRFGHAFAFRDPNAEIRVPFPTGLDLGPNDSFTAECFVKPDPNAADGHILAKHPDPSTASAQAGWALSIGGFGRGVNANVRFLVTDGPNPVILFSDARLGSDSFHHLAGVLDRSRRLVRLYVDGILVREQPTGNLGALTNGEPVQIGRAGTAAFQGLIDEVRLSRAARQSFHPVLTEDDEVYRRRLAIFRRWNLPTRANLESVLNTVVGPIAGQSNAIVVDDANSTLTVAELPVTIHPVQLAPRETISSSGDRRVKETDVSGAADDPTFDPAFLRTVSTATGVTFAPPPARTLSRGEPSPDTHKMQVVVAHAFNALAGLLSAQPGLTVRSGFDPRADDLRRVGRALVFSHPTLAPGQLAAKAQRAGFDFVAVRADAVYASCKSGDYLDIAVTTGAAGGTATPANGFDALPGQTLVLTVDPPLPRGVEYRWTTIPCGAGRGCFVNVNRDGVQTCDPTSLTLPATLRVTSPGALAVKVEANLFGRTAGGNHTFQVGIDQLADHGTIAAGGSLDVPESIAGIRQPDDFFDPAYLVTHDRPRVTYGTDLNHRRIQGSVAARLNRLLDLLAAAPGDLQVVAAFTPGATDLTGLGRGMTLTHQTLAPGRLAAMAHAAGFAFVRNEGGQVFVREGPADLLSIDGQGEIDEGAPDPQPLTVNPRALPSGVALSSSTVVVANSGTDMLSQLDPATGQVRRAIKVGWNPVAVALDPLASRAYTADLRSNTVTAVDLATGAVLSSIGVRDAPVALAHHPTQPRLYVACRDGNAVQMIDTGTMAVTGTLAVAARPVALAVRPDGAEIWVALDTSNSVATIAVATFALGPAIALAGGPAGVAFLPDGSQAYVTLRATGQLAVITVASRAVVSQNPAGSAPSPVAAAADGSAVLVGNLSSGPQPRPELLILNPDGTQRGSVRVQEPVALAANATRAFVASRAGNALSVIDIAERGLANTFTLGTGLGEHPSWVVRLGRSAQAHLDSTTAPQVNLRADRAGQAIVLAVYTLSDHNIPYQFTVELSPDLLTANPNVVIPKDQYDLLMNILNTLRPAGVEVFTRPIRERVIEVRTDQLNAFPDYTYPNYRARGPALRRPTNGG